MRRLALGALFVLVARGAHADATVNLCAEDTQAGPGTNLAAALASGGRITFACGGPATIVFRRSHEIRRNTEIDGQGQITFDGARNLRMFTGTGPWSFRLVGLTIVNGGRQTTGPLSAPGGVIRGSLFVELLRTTVDRSWWPIWLTGGSIRVREGSFSDNDGTVIHGPIVEILERSRFSTNRGSPLSMHRGMAVIWDSEFSANGPSLCEEGTLRIKRSRFFSHAGTSGGALRVDCDATIENSEFRNNRADTGGAIHVGARPTTVSITGSEFHDNRATTRGGAIAVQHSAQRLQLVLRHVTFEGNQAQVGGALDLEQGFINARSLQAAAVSFLGNRAANMGGAIYAIDADLRIARGAFVENHAGVAGGALAVWQQGQRTTELANSLLVRNVAPSGAAFWGNAATLVNTTIADHAQTAVWAQPRSPLPSDPPGTSQEVPIRFRNTVLAGGASGPCGAAPGAAPYLDLGHNLQHPGTTCGATIASAEPLLGPYYVPLPFSPAREGGDATVCADPPINGKDLYGVRRPLSANCAIGAAEGNISHLIARWLRRRKEGRPAAR